jgi:glycosyltransferase involved in cell wall biosynthesis
MSNTRVLIIASDFPPLVGTNTQRIQSFVRHLPAHGWETTVVTQAIDDLPACDLRDLARIPATTRIIRVPDPDPFAARARSKRARLTAAPPASRMEPRSAETGDSPASATHGTTAAGLKKVALSHASAILKWGLRTFFYHPDALRPWADRVVRVATEGLAGDCQAILTSSPAYSCHLAGLALKQSTGLPWVADFRDLWVGRPYRTYHSAWHKWVDERLEARVISQCDALILASPAWEETFASRYGEKTREKIAVLTNGYEAESFDRARAEVPEHEPGHTFVLTGSMHEAESPLPFLEALRTLQSQHPGVLDDVRVTFIGNAGDHLPALMEAASRTGMGGRITFLPARSNEECIRAQLAADYLLLFSAKGHEDTIRGKSFEYMAAGKPILACIPPAGIQADILKNAGNAIVVPHGDSDAIASAVLSLIKDNGALPKPNLSFVQQFDRAAIAARLAEQLNGLVGR